MGLLFYHSKESSNTKMDIKEIALSLHKKNMGKISLKSKVEVKDAKDLSIFYTPGVAEPCKEIAKNCDAVYDYTSKGNWVAVVTNVTAVLGLGDIVPYAGLPVMECKAILFKEFGGVDAFPICVKSKNADEIVNIVKAIEPSFGGINLEDIGAPMCFDIENRLIDEMDIPVFHDDQHGTAVVALAAIMNSLKIVGKKISEVKIVINGAGAAGTAVAKLLLKYGAKDIIMCDKSGAIYDGRNEDMNKYKKEMATITNKDKIKGSVHDVIKDADIFIGLSVANAIGEDDVKNMNKFPIVMAMANPVPEIMPEVAKKAGARVVCTGRSDFPNQVNNVLGFPFIFRGALDVRATTINEEMKIAAAYALARLAREEVPEIVKRAYGVKELKFGPEYIIPKPFDPRVLTWVAPAVAKAAMDSGVARHPIADFEEYKRQLDIRMGRAQLIMTPIFNKAASNPKRIVFPEGTEPKIIRSATLAVSEGIAKPILLGKKEIIEKIAAENDYDLTGIEIVDPETYPS